MCLTTRQYGFEEQTAHLNWWVKIIKKQVEQLMEMIFEWKEIFSSQNWIDINKIFKGVWEHHKEILDRNLTIKKKCLEPAIVRSEESSVLLNNWHMVFRREYEFMLFCRKREITWKQRTCSLWNCGADIEEGMNWEEIYNQQWKQYRWALSRGNIEDMKYDF